MHVNTELLVVKISKCRLRFLECFLIKEAGDIRLWWF